MKYLIISGNPKTEGLCHSMEEQIQRGAADGGAQVEVLKVDKLERCHVCGDGWGTCRGQHQCAFEQDGFGEAQEAVRGADQICIVTQIGRAHV